MRLAAHTASIRRTRCPAGRGIDADLDEVRPEGRLLVIAGSRPANSIESRREVRRRARHRRGARRARRNAPRRPAKRTVAASLKPSCARSARADACRRRRRRRSNSCRPIARRSRPRPEVRSEAYVDLRERHAEAAWRQLGDDGVAAGADVGRIGPRPSRVRRARAAARAGFHDQVVAKRVAATPVVVEPAAGAGGRTGLRCASRSARHGAAGTRPAGAARSAVAGRADRPACRCGCQLDRIEAELFGKLVDRDLQRHQSRCLAGARLSALPSGRSSVARRSALRRWAPA